ncbi:MAG: lysoplasmalogenase [Cyclobacteriaceae bacterium]
MKVKLIFWAYIAVSATNLVAQTMQSVELNQFTKPVLMPLLIFYIYESSKGKVTLKTLLLSLAILFSWLGDVALLYQSNQLYFMIGIGLFLFAQLTYVLVLKKATFQTPSFDLLKVIPYAVFAVLLFALLLPNAGSLAIPIFVYGIVICVMAGTARLRDGNTSHDSYRLALYGSLLFLASDSILAINKFYMEIPIPGLWIMATYTAAQLLLVVGVLKHVD